MKFVTALILFMISTVAVAQYTIRGEVTDANSKTPLPGASVFIARTTKGTSTDANGTFAIGGLSAGHFQLVISFIGYEKQVFDVQPEKNLALKIRLAPVEKLLDEVTVVARKTSRIEWLNNFALFKDHFIGQSENSKFCTISNPSVLHFDNRDRILTCSADSILNLDNYGLGYRISILLGVYEYNAIKVRTHYQGEIVYSLLPPASDIERKNWARNRLKAYYGSQMHFFRSMYTKTLADQGFFVNLIQNVQTKNGVKRMGIADSTVTFRAGYNQRLTKMLTTSYNRFLDSLQYVPTLKYEGELEVTYAHENQSYFYQTQNNGPMPLALRPQKSMVKLMKPTVVQENGAVYPGDGIESFGYWSWELIAESLPLDYDPKDDEEIIHN